MEQIENSKKLMAEAKEIQNLAINGLYYNLEDVVSADLIKDINKERIDVTSKKN